MDSLFSITGLAVKVNAPRLMGGDEIDDLTDTYSELTLAANVEVGYDTAKITVDAERDYIEEWFENGLEREITVYDQEGTVVYQGWVNQLDIAFGALTLTRGPILNITNRAETKYTPLDNSVYPPVTGTPRKTAITYDLDSEARYGVWHKVLDASEVSDALADQFQATYLAEYAWPETSQALALGSTGSTPRMVLNCLGYGYWLQAYPVAENTDTYRTVTAQIQAVLALSPNAIFSTDYTQMVTNGLLVPSLEQKDTMALDYIKSLVALGDASDNRWIFGVYAGQRVYYNAIPTTVLYNYVLSAQGQRLTYAEEPDRIAYPWNVKPGQWVQTTDLLVGRISGLIGLRDDPRNLFIESVEYTAPFGLRLNGKKINTIPQMLAKMGAGQL